MEKEVKVGNITIGTRPFVFIGGPCVIEGRDVTLRHAERIAKITGGLGIPFIFKSSYDKANRSSSKSYRGPGLKKGLNILSKVKEKYCLPVLTDGSARTATVRRDSAKATAPHRADSAPPVRHTAPRNPARDGKPVKIDSAARSWPLVGISLTVGASP